MENKDVAGITGAKNIVQAKIEHDIDDKGKAANEEDENNEQKLLHAAEHVKKVSSHCNYCQIVVKLAIYDTVSNTPQCDHKYTFVVDYGQNMECLNHPGVVYYYAALSSYNLRVGDHATILKKGEMKRKSHGSRVAKNILRLKCIFDGRFTDCQMAGQQSYFCSISSPWVA